MEFLQAGPYRLSLERPLLMGIVNLTPDSFSGDGLSGDSDRAITHARRLLEEGADILDLGAESTRPGALETPIAEELRRLLPVLEELSSWGVPVSVDTYKPAVMREALKHGVAMINDITGAANPETIELLAAADCAVCLMHMQGVPRTMQQAPVYDDVVADVRNFLLARVTACRMAGIDRERITLDPGFGFGKTLADNLALFRALTAFAIDDLPVLVGISRKSMLGMITGRPVADRMAASVVSAVLAAQNGANILRVHDVAATRDGLSVLAAIG
jgi:dihydropteroate synthase